MLVVLAHGSKVPPGSIFVMWVRTDATSPDEPCSFPKVHNWNVDPPEGGPIMYYSSAAIEIPLQAKGPRSSQDEAAFQSDGPYKRQYGENRCCIVTTYFIHLIPYRLV